VKRATLWWLPPIGYVVLLGLWLAANYGLNSPPSVATDEVGGALVAVAAPLMVGLVVGRWWTVALPLSALVIAMPFQLAGARGPGFDPLEPLVAAVYIVAVFGCPAAAVGVTARKLTSRLARPDPRRRRMPLS
jgi:hypothetical protein